MKTYEIKKIHQKRRQTHSIILTQMKNLYEEGTNLPPYVKMINNHYTWNIWQHYFYRVLSKEQMPIHYFIEQVGTDYNVSVGQPEFAFSYFLRDLADKSIIPEFYRSSIVIGLEGDFSFELAEQRLYEQLVFRIIVPLLVRNFKNQIDRFDIKYIDEIIDYKKYNSVREIDKDFKYVIEPAPFYKKLDMDMYIKKYLSAIQSI
jgi:hypothetical protein